MIDTDLDGGCYRKQIKKINLEKLQDILDSKLEMVSKNSIYSSDFRINILKEEIRDRKLTLLGI